MKQQNPNKQSYHTRRSQHFKFKQYDLQDQDKLFGIFAVNNDKNNKKDIFGKWQDYVTLQSDEFSRIKQSSDLYETQQKSEIPYKKQQIIKQQIAKPVVNNKKQSKNQQKKQTKKPRYTQYQQVNKKQVNYQPVISNMKTRQSTNRPPFDIPQISQIKKYQSSMQMRNSEKYLLDILQNNRKSQKKQQEQNNKNHQKVQQIKKKETKPTQKNNKQQQKIKQNTIKQKPKQTTVKQKPKQTIQQKPIKNIKKQPVTNQDDLQRKSQAAKSKRVTIHDKGKIKFTTDSMTVDFQPILPSQLRYRPSTGKKQTKVIEQQDQQYDYQQPMDIVQPQQNYQNKVNKQNKKQNKKQIKKQNKKQNKKQMKKQVQQNDYEEDNPKVQYLNQKRKPVQRIVDKQQTKSVPKQQTKSKNKSKNKNKKSKPKPQKITIKQQKKPQRSQPIQQKRKLKQNDDLVLIQTVSSAASVQSNRPKRTRTTKLKYWQNQKMIYNKEGMCIGKSITNSQLFLRILGFIDYDKITTKDLSFSQSKIAITICLKGRQMIYSRGINYKIFKQELKNAQQYNKIDIKCIHSDIRKQFVEYVINDLVNKKNDVIVQSDQTFSIKNKNDKVAINIEIVLYKQ